MKYIALNGFGHSLRRYFPASRVRCIDRFNWTKRSAILFAKHITEPTTVIGFSDGATAAITIGNNSHYVTKVYAHSPMYRDEPIRPGIEIQLFRTIGDVTPTFKATGKVLSHYKLSEELNTISLMDLKPGRPEKVTDIATFVMAKMNHQFRNCLPHLPKEITSEHTALSTMVNDGP